MKNIYKFSTFLLLLFCNQTLPAQNKSDSNTYKTVAAGPEYKRSALYQALWGKNYRKEWITPVTFPITKFDTLRGGLVIYKVGGGHQSKSLRLKSIQDKEYALRTVNKSLKILIPEIFHGTFAEHIANDAISMSHPYGASGVPVMSKAAGLGHTYPQLMWVPKQPGFDTLNEDYGDRLYLFEQRAAGDWSEADNFFNFKSFTDSEKLLEKMYEDNDHQVDQVTFVRARLFDMIIGDWDRHWDQWKWGEVEKGDDHLYVPIPTDRDQAFSTTGGLLLKAAISAGGMKYIQPFDYTIKNVTATERRFLDRLFTNKLLLEDWLKEAKSLQQALTDNVIEGSIRQMPAEIFAIRGNEIIAKLKSRRDHLHEYAATYFKFLAEEVEIVGSKKSEYFEVNQLNDNETIINVYNIKDGERKNNPFYSRTFKTNETGEIRLFGLSGNDIYNITGNSTPGIKLRIIGGDEKDSIINNSNLRIHVYDNSKNTFKGKNRLHLSDSTDHSHFYDTYIPDKKGIGPQLGYSREDKIYVGLAYTSLTHKWRKLPFASRQSFGVKYSITQKAFSFFYKGIFPGVIGKWDLLLNADYDLVRWLNFYGVGNETKLTTTETDFNRSRTKDNTGSLGFQRKFGKNTVDISGFFQSIEIKNDADRYIAKNIAPFQSDIFETNDYVGAQFNYKFAHFNDSIVPTSGFSFLANASHYNNLTQSTSFQRYSGIAQLYIPLISKISIGIRAAGGTVTGSPMFYHLQTIGGANDLRGYKRERFWGKTAFANSNELRFITKLRSYLMNGKIGLNVFYDQGRVWNPNENSDTWHTDYGAGLLLAPFNAVFANITYGISKEAKVINVRVYKYF
jgi:hypothetical protein